VAANQPVVVVNQTLARQLAQDARIVGRAVKFGVPVFNRANEATAWSVVGVVADTLTRDRVRQSSRRCSSRRASTRRSVQLD